MSQLDKSAQPKQLHVYLRGAVAGDVVLTRYDNSGKVILPLLTETIADQANPAITSLVSTDPPSTRSPHECRGAVSVL